MTDASAGLSQLKEKYVFSDNTIDALGVGIRQKKNILLWGPGGHAKSDLAEAVAMLYYQQSDVFIGQMGRGATIESLLGYVNVSKMMNGDGEREYNHSASFMAKKIALFDELLDTPPMLLEYLKDILTRRMYCANGTMCFKSETEVIIACTNRDPIAWANEGTPEDQASKKAFLGRFPLIVEVAWPSYGQMEFTKLFNAIFTPDKIMAGKLAVVAELVSKSHKKGVFISPRDSRHIAELYLTEGVNGIKFSGIPPEVLNRVIEQEAQIAKDFESLEKLKPVEAMLATIEKEIKTSTDYFDLIQWHEDLNEVNKKLGGFSVGEHAVQTLGALRTKVLKLAHEAQEKADKVRVRAPKNILKAYNIQL